MSLVKTATLRLAEAAHYAAGIDMPSVDEAALVSPQRVQGMLAAGLGEAVGRVRVTGTLERRLVCIERLDGRWVLADLSGRPHQSRRWPSWASSHLNVENPESWLSLATLGERAVHRLSRPEVLLAALYHPEHFPLPRFPLGISDVARAARSTLTGTVALTDLQLGVSLEQLVDRVRLQRPDILGISATFGQHDLMTRLLDAAFQLSTPPLVIAGGSLTARNEALLLRSYPELLIARGAGEATIEGLLAYWHQDIALDQVPGLGFNGASRGGGMTVGRRHTARPPTRDATGDIFPELDLMPETFEHHGVAQLETSRGCTNFCSFCPRGHKGLWSGSAPGRLPWMLEHMRNLFDRYPTISRTVYLVDEEFIGRDDDAGRRALEIARVIDEAGFRWESSCRVDQVVRTDRGLDWHAGRAAMWRTLTRLGLRRMLFGVESGVDSILGRFAKETTGQQNALAIRTLSALGIPTRFTYITFDHLMTLDELRASYAWQGRTDLLLRPQPHLTPAQIAQGVRDEAFVSGAADGAPLHTAISYMLVSMECLIGAAYTRKVQTAGLAGEARPSMGSVDARFADWRIGIASHWAQLWVDRNFALDYTLKSLEKILDGRPRDVARQARLVLKDASYSVLGEMIAVIETGQLTWTAIGQQQLDNRIRTALEIRVGVLRGRMDDALREVAATLPARHVATLHHEYQRWESADGWRLINAADPCGT
jgi:hypothetical protein